MTTLKKKKDSIIKELAKLERMNWAKDESIADTIFPYVLLEAINLLKNSKLIDNPVDYTKTSEDSKKMLAEILKEKYV